MGQSDILVDRCFRGALLSETTKQSIDAEIAAEIEAADASLEKQAEAAEANIRTIKAKALLNIESIASETAVEVVSTLTGKAPTAAAVRAAMPN